MFLWLKYHSFARMVTQLYIEGLMAVKTDKKKSLKIWLGRLKQVEEKGNCLGYMGEQFFSDAYTPHERLEYVKSMIRLNM